MVKRVSIEADNYSGGSPTPEQILMVSVLKRAILDYLGPSDTASRKALTLWFTASDSKDPFSFANICLLVNKAPTELFDLVRKSDKPKISRIIDLGD